MLKYLREILKRKDLLVYLVVSGLKAQYRNTFFGYFWWILDPMLMGVVYFLLRVYILGMKGENIGAFLIIGLLSWKWVSSTMGTSANSISGKANIITQVYLPKVIFPFSTSLTQLINYSFGLVVVAVFLAAYRIVPGTEALWLPFIMLVQFLFLSAVSMFIAYICMFIKDIDNVLTHFTRLWFWSTPIIWETGRLPAKYSFIVDYNPVSAMVISYRNVLMYGISPLMEKLLIIGLLSIVLNFLLIYYYYLNEHKIIRAL